jgi:hypothetical protein
MDVGSGGDRNTKRRDGYAQGQALRGVPYWSIVLVTLGLASGATAQTSASSWSICAATPMKPTATCEMSCEGTLSLTVSGMVGTKGEFTCGEAFLACEVDDAAEGGCHVEEIGPGGRAVAMVNIQPRAAGHFAMGAGGVPTPCSRWAGKNNLCQADVFGFAGDYAWGRFKCVNTKGEITFDNKASATVVLDGTRQTDSQSKIMPQDITGNARFTKGGISTWPTPEGYAFTRCFFP